MANAVVARCPVCAEQLKVVRLECDACGTSLQGSFSLGRFHALAAEQLEFLEVFIRARGFPSQAEPDREAERRKEILRELAEGRIKPEDAASLLETETAR